MMWITLVIIHGLLAVALLGALTHQGVSVVWVGARRRSFVERFAAVGSPNYVTAIIVIFVITFLFGAYIYTTYRVDVRPPLEELRLYAPIGLFDLKEHFITLSLALLPTYWFLWKRLPLSEHRTARTVTTLTIAVCVWYGFLVGHILNDLRGLGT
jgi:hypothetical protein